MSANIKRPCYQEVDGFRLSLGFLPDVFRNALKYKPRDGDFFVVTFPKCGTTWTQQIVNLIFNRGVSATDFANFSRVSPYMELFGVESVEHMQGPGPIKVHLPYHVTPYSPQAKYLYVVRNPKDTLISFFHHTNNVFYKFEDGNFDDFFEIFLNGENDYGDYFDHVLGWYEHRNDSNVLLVTYEELKRKNQETIMKIAAFMGDKYLKMLQEEPEVLKNVLKHSSVEYMKMFNEIELISKDTDMSHPAMEHLPPGLRHVIKFNIENPPSPDKPFQLVRKGLVGGWRQVLSEDQNTRLNQKIDKMLKGTELYDYWKSIGCM